MIKKAQDVLNDSSHAVLYKIAQEVTPPDYVMTGVPLDKEAAAATGDALFADPRNRRYPLTDKANTWLSGTYFAKTASDSYGPDEYSYVADRILRAARMYGISGDVESAMSKIASRELELAEKQAEADAKLADACYGEPETGGFPMFDEEQVKMANDYFEENAYEYDWRRRANIAKNIMRKSAEYGIVPAETVRKEAGAGFPRTDFLAENLLARESMLRQNHFDKMAGDMRRTIKIVCEADPEELLAQLEPLREMISGSDELCGLDREYGRRLLPPADFLFDIGDDEARSFKEDTVPLCGRLMSASALSNLPRKIFESVMSPSMVDGLFDGGHMSPKKISITIIRMKPGDQRSLMDNIMDFTSNAGADMPDDAENIEEAEGAEEADDGKDDDGKKEK